MSVKLKALEILHFQKSLALSEEQQYWQNAIDQVEQLEDTSEKRIADLEDALRFYASNNWNDPNQVGSKDPTAACIRDEGKRARKALGEK